MKNMKNKINIKENLKETIPYIFIFFFPILWYLVLKQHSYTHVNFTYRLLIISIICILIIVEKILKFDKKESNS